SAVDDPRISADLQAALTRAQAFEKSHRRKIASLTSNDAELLVSAVKELEDLFELMDKPAVYAMLVHSACTAEPRHGALLSRTREERKAINKHLIFFDLEWIQLGDEPARALFSHAKLSKYRHYLEQKRAWKPHCLSEPEEKILDEK